MTGPWKLYVIRYKQSPIDCSFSQKTGFTLTAFGALRAEITIGRYKDSLLETLILAFKSQVLNPYDGEILWERCRQRWLWAVTSKLLHGRSSSKDEWVGTKKSFLQDYYPISCFFFNVTLVISAKFVMWIGQQYDARRQCSKLGRRI